MNDPTPNPNPNPPPDALDAYLDGLLNAAAQARFAERLGRDAALRAELELRRTIDRQVRALFQPPAAPPLELTSSERAAESRRGEELAERFGSDENATEPSVSVKPARASANSARRVWWGGRSLPYRWQLVGLGVTTAAIWAFLVWALLPSRRADFVFTARPLTEVYRETVDHGFEPYYICEDDERFRSTFYHRHGQALRLADLPAGRQMVGLSYLPAISRHSTAMLAKVDQQPVIVFVDKLSRDRPIETPPETSGLRMFRRELSGLVLYEITPFDEPRMISFLLPADPPAGACAPD
jgi:hypothetical protein